MSSQERHDVTNRLNALISWFKDKETPSAQFGYYKPDFVITIEIMNKLDLDMLNDVPLNILTGLEQSLVGFHKQLEAYTSGLTIKVPSWQEAESLNRKSAEVTKWLLTTFGIIEASKEPLPRGTEEILSFLKGVKDEAGTALKQVKEAVKAVDDAQRQLNDKLNNLGVSDYAQVFKDQSEEHYKASKNWFGGVIALLIIIVVYAVLLLLLPAPKENHDMIQVIIAKALIATALFMALSLAIRNYKAEKHNQVVNKHRFNALRTFETFTTASNDDDTKNAVLLEATRAIFNSQTSGFHSVDGSDSVDYPSRVLEIVKSSKSQ